MSKAAVQIYVRLIGFVFMLIGVIALVSSMIAMAKVNRLVGAGFDVTGATGSMAYMPTVVFGGTGLLVWVASEAFANLIHVED